MDYLTWRDKLDKFKLPIGLSLVGIVLIVGGMLLNKPKPPQAFPKESLVESQKIISIDVSGAVNKPGVYQLDNGSRIEDAIKAAGGFTQDVNQEYISKTLNLAQKLSDGSKVYVPATGEQGKTTWEVGFDSSQVNGQAKININTATQAELEALPGIGPGYASKIISDRPYQAVDELLSKKIIPQAVFNKIKDQLVTY